MKNTTPAPSQRGLRLLSPMLLLAMPAFANATVDGDTPSPVQQVRVSASLIPLGVADSANQGTVTARQLENRPLLRTGELLEAVPGLIVTQHAGDGKANQYFARGFNLDHGTDFRTTVMGMPVNLPTNAHGQGYSDLNFLIPELVSTIAYKKGTYYAEEGDFSVAGAAAFDYVRHMEQGLLSLEAGQNRFSRALLANATPLAAGTLLYALERAGQDGPWETPEDYKRVNGVLSYSWRRGDDDVRVTAMGMHSSWTSTDQVPQRALDAGLIGRYGTLAPTDGGDTSRYSLSGEWRRQYGTGSARANAYIIASRLDLFSDFTYALDDPEHGDQFHQAESRQILGLDAQRAWRHALGPFASETAFGVQLRQDRLAPVGLYLSQARQRRLSVREDRVKQRSGALYLSNSTVWAPWLRTVAGLRADRYGFDVHSDTGANSGKVNAGITSPKFTAIFTLGNNAEMYLNWGRGFHSNDARGVTGTVDPRTGLAVDADGADIKPATPLVRGTGKEAGLRLAGLVPGMQTTIAAWKLDLDSELIFIGDAGTTEAGRPSRRHGVELANFYTPARDWIIDANLAWSHARFRDSDPAGAFIPGSITRTASLGVSGAAGPWSGGVRLRYFGPRALVEDDSVRSPSSTLLNMKLGYRLAPRLKLTIEVLNLLDRRVSDIDYYYASQLPGEPAPVADIHTHPGEMRTLRAGLAWRF
ncbi:TonB-dependent receptor [Massilia sp. CCM 9210]|uniref:TonB-dependent receptor n=1 Tax=Massilia scottii TaxID=3057166 RepID=UPI002796518E|nr:TonB-dependent receptor [Massilia sp. CCM 9210]MDQ1812362.1 TonB-dependent receptor [Massilia sp. CCM 9210]